MLPYVATVKRKDSLKGKLNRVLFLAGFEFLKILLLNTSNTSNVNTECAGMSKQRHPLCDQPLGALIYFHFIVLISIYF